MMAEKEREKQHTDRLRRMQQAKQTGVPSEEYNDLEHLKQQYIDGELTESEFEARLEQLDSLEESDTGRSELEDVRKNLVQGALIGGAIAFITATATLGAYLLGGSPALQAAVCLLIPLLSMVFVWRSLFDE